VTYCLNTGCRHCATDIENGTIICTIDPQLIGVGTLKGWMVKCNSYKYRPAGQSLGPVTPIGADGLYPGQIKPPTDYSDVDPDIVSDKECDT
jgi:hypothetical protein